MKAKMMTIVKLARMKCCHADVGDVKGNNDKGEMIIMTRKCKEGSAGGIDDGDDKETTRKVDSGNGEVMHLEEVSSAD